MISKKKFEVSIWVFWYFLGVHIKRFSYLRFQQFLRIFNPGLNKLLSLNFIKFIIVFFSIGWLFSKRLRGTIALVIAWWSISASALQQLDWRTRGTASGCRKISLFRVRERYCVSIVRGTTRKRSGSSADRDGLNPRTVRQTCVDDAAPSFTASSIQHQKYKQQSRTTLAVGWSCTANGL